MTLARLFLRRDVAATWQSANPTLSAGEPGFESDQFRLRIGNGALAFNALRAFLSVPTGAIGVAQALLNATTQAAQRTAIGLTSPLVALNSIGGTAQVVTDLDDVHALGSGFYIAGVGAANNPDGTTITGIYTKANANDGQFIGFGALGGVNPPRMWTRNRAAGVWGAWQSWAGYAQETADWNAASTPGFWWGKDTAANAPGAYYLNGITISRTDDEGCQILFRSGVDGVWFRRLASGVWQSWTEIVHAGNLLARMRSVFATVPYVSSEQTITSGGRLTLAHGLGVRPSLFGCTLRCKTAEAGWSVGDDLMAELSPSGATKINSIWADATNVFVQLSDQAGCFNGANKSTGAAVVLTNANWRLIVRAYP